MNLRAGLTLILLILSLSQLPLIHSCTPESQKSQHPQKNQLIENFSKADWGTVVEAKEALESSQAASIPLLLPLLDRDEKVELVNTADLIYPGAKKFYGHGWGLNYDVDWISVRAGWALEELTFQDLGFSEDSFTNPKPPDIKKRMRAEAVARAKAWWQNAQKSWNRFDAMLEALKSDNTVRQFRTLGWIRSGKTRCDGLSVESFEQQIVPEAKKLSKSDNEGVRVQATHLLADKDQWWLKYKTQSQSGL